MMTKKAVLAAFSSILLLSSCIKDDTDDANSPGGAIGDTTVLKTGKGFTQVHALYPVILKSLTGINNGFSDGFFVADMTLSQGGDSLHIASVEEIGLQGGGSSTLARHALNPATQAVLSAPEGSSVTGSQISAAANPSDQTQFDTQAWGFLEGSPKFYYSAIEGTGFGLSKATMTGDVTYGRGPATFIRKPRASTAGLVVEDPFGDANPRTNGLFSNRIFFAYRAGNFATFTYQSDRIVATRADAISNGVLEPKAFGTAPGLMLFLVSEKYLYAAEAPGVNPMGGPPINLTYLDSIPLTNGINWASPHIRVRHPKGSNKIGLLVTNNDLQDPTFLSASFDKATRRLTTNIPGEHIPNFAAGGVNWDLDPDGNLYFDNRANNFQSDSTISLYKLNGSTFSTIGQDDILKSGSIRKVKWLNGKVYAGVSYAWRKSTAANAVRYHRIAILRAD